MAEVISGKNLILFFRKYDNRATEDASKLRFQTEHSISLENETEGTITKDGNINTISDGENTISITSLAYIDDTETIETWRELRKYFKQKALVEVWQIDTASATGDQYDAEYYQGYFSSFELSAPADDKVELSFEFAINGNGAEGTDVLTDEQKQAVAAVQYEYAKMAKTGE
ncbi:phage major tail protein, TP901-1 family [Streptococcus sp. H31]|uniref:phage major tail protein, TP901-1 family n=1 Tax=Streptococcus huangxiaojuni TaxID=3237239 RepID=UPI0034A424F1